jgi:plastocyanin
MEHVKRHSPAALWLAVTAAVILVAVLLARQTGMPGNGVPDGNGSPAPAPETGQPPARPPVTVTVTVKDFAFDPAFLEVPAGSTVIWSYPEGRFTHQIVLRDLNARSEKLLPGQEWRYTFATPGSYLVLDAVYKSMIGRVNVTG